MSFPDLTNNKRTNQKLKNHKTKQQTWICSRLFVSLSLRSKILSLDKSKSKTSFYLDLFSLIRNSELRSKFLDKPSENKFSWSFRSGKAN